MWPLRSRFGFLTLLCWLCAASVTHGATLPSGFAETRVATGIGSPTAMAIAPDGRIFVAQQGGALRVVRNGALLAQPFLTVSVNASGERGLLGVAFDPNFASNNFVYVYYTTSSSPIHNRVSRFTASAANPDVAAAGSEVQILNLPNLSSATNHNGGAIHFGTDGKLYVAVGENANSSNAPSLNTTLGKMLRINADGSIPSDNPFFSQTTGLNQAIWARGLRNPFTFAVDPTNGRIHINDVGEVTWEEVNQGVAGSNYGWPQTEGNNPAGVAGVRYPIHTFNHSGGVCAITGGAFYRPATATFPAEYAGRYFFGDFCAGFIRTLSPPNYTTPTAFATGVSSLADIQVHPDGSLYYLARGGGGELFRVQFTANTAPSISTHPASVTVSAGQSATFAVTASGTAPLAYQWQRNGANIAGATSRTYTLTTSPADNGAMFRVLVSNASGSALSNSATLTVLTNSTPAGRITAPVNNTSYRGGQVIAFSGTGSDAEDGNLPPSAFTWRVDFHHDDHVHPFMANTSGITTGTFTIANRGETSANVFYRVYLTVRDSSGLTHTSTVDVRPLTSVVRIESNVANAQLTLDGAPITAPFQFTGVEGVIRTLGVVTPQTSGGTTYEFVSWSDGGQATHEITTPSDNTTFTALFQPAATTTLFSDNFEAARGWTLTTGANTAPRGLWARGDPQPTTFNGVTLQPGTCDASVNCFVTGLVAGSAVGSADVDEGMTSVQSPAIALPAGGAVTLRFRYFLAHNNNATSADYFRVRVVGTSGTPQTVFTRAGTGGTVVGGAWTTQTVNISAFAGQTVRLRFEAADAAAGSIIEAGFDNVSVTRQ
ncbi:MAG TPA: PQQ-dependent sugar dehydrogenase [Steroidobacteraceae bacterium]|nr:PQQ-dependent sugar dehydrogenase [Steroidobacteraceae bacterium]